MATQSKSPETGTIKGTVIDVGLKGKTGNPVVGATVSVKPEKEGYTGTALTDEHGCYVFLNVPPGKYQASCDAFLSKPEVQDKPVSSGKDTTFDFKIPVGLNLTFLDRELHECTQFTAGAPVTLRAGYNSGGKATKLEWHSDQGELVDAAEPNEVLLLTEGVLGKVNVSATLSDVGSPSVTAGGSFNVLPAVTQQVGGQLGVTLKRSDVPPTYDLGLWAAIRSHSKALSFGGIGAKGVSGAIPPRGYQGFIDKVLCGDGSSITGGPTKICGPAPDLGKLSERSKALPRYGIAAYELLKTATEVFLLWNCGVAVRRTDALGNAIVSDDEERSRSGLTVDQVVSNLTDYLGSGRLPYIERIVRTAFPGQLRSNSMFCTGVLTSKVDCPCLIELIWSYWHEEGMLVQCMNAISRRFQNVRGPGDRDPLAHLEIDPLRPLNNLLWGYIQDEWNRLTLQRRSYEYDHHYGLTMYGKAVPTLRTADSRSKFVEAFHHLLHLCSVFYKEDNDTTVIADGFPLLNALKEVHLLLSQGAHNQFGDLPWTARIEMLMQQWLLARPEMRDFLQSRPMVPYTEAWMPQVDTMKTLQGWSDVTITHFRDLGAFGEQILLTVRYGDWIELNDENHAKNWARYWRPEIQGYLHAYRAATGVDLTNPDTVDTAMPAIHLQKRLATQRVR